MQMPRDLNHCHSAESFRHNPRFIPLMIRISRSCAVRALYTFANKVIHGCSRRFTTKLLRIFRFLELIDSGGLFTLIWKTRG
jgi:hypothetical protein